MNPIKPIFFSLISLISFSTFAVYSDKSDSIETITADYDDITPDEAQRIENATVLTVKYLMMTQRDLKKKSYSRAREALKIASQHADEAYHMLPTSIVRDKIELAKIALDAEENRVFLDTLVPISVQVESSDMYTQSSKEKIGKYLKNSKVSLRKGDRSSAKKNMDLVMGVIDANEIDADVINLLNVCEQAMAQIEKRKFTSAQKTITNSDVFFVYYAEELISPRDNRKKAMAH